MHIERNCRHADVVPLFVSHAFFAGARIQSSFEVSGQRQSRLNAPETASTGYAQASAGSVHGDPESTGSAPLDRLCTFSAGLLSLVGNS